MTKDLNETYLESLYDYALDCCFQDNGKANFNLDLIDQSVIHCMLDLLSLIENELSPLEKVGFFTAKQYWYSNQDKELLSVIKPLRLIMIDHANSFKSEKYMGTATCIACVLENRTTSPNVDFFEEFEYFTDALGLFEINMTDVENIFHKNFDFIFNK